MELQEMNKIFTFGDGFATGHIWPEWPDILSAIYPSMEIINTSAIGAGSEFLVNAILSKTTQNIDGMYLIQWPHPCRFDKLIENKQWDQIINTDTTYAKNVYYLNDKKWWVSSESMQSEVRMYHDFYIEKQQAELRNFNYMILLKNYLENNNIQYRFMLTYAADYLSEFEKKQLITANWCWHKPWHGMSEYSVLDKYINIRQNEVQPSPIIHIDWLVECLLPTLNISLDQINLTLLKNLIYDQKWAPFHWDRKQIWINLLNKLDRHNR
jgi:hypothetical protein